MSRRGLDQSSRLIASQQNIEVLHRSPRRALAEIVQHRNRRGRPRSKIAMDRQCEPIGAVERLWQDARRMRKLGISFVRIGEFAWSRIEPEPGRFEWDWLDRAVELARAAGLEVVMGTPRTMSVSISRPSAPT